MRGMFTLISSISLCVLSAGCSLQTTATAMEGARTHGTASPARATAQVARTSGYRSTIAAAIREQRVYSPAGDNAFEMYLALDAVYPDDASIKIALLELSPYLVIATEQSLQRGDVAEARRLIGLIAAADVQASALPRLRAGAESQDTMPPSQPQPGTRNTAVEAANAVAVQ